MAEIKVTDLPTITLDDFTENDRFLVIDDGKTRQLTRGVFQQWLETAVKGEKGDQGPAGRDGINGTNGANGQKGADGLSAYQIAVSQGYSGSLSSWLTSLRGATGATGANGLNGWSPLLRIVPRGLESVVQVYDWTGGTGKKPETLGYLGEGGIVTNIINAVNIKGLQGPKGDSGAKGETGTKGADGKDGKTLQRATYGEAGTLTLKFNDGTSVVSDSPLKETGYAVYADGQFLDSNPLVIAPNTQEVLPNNAVSKVEVLPYNVETFYDSVTQKYKLSSNKGLYSVRVKFKITPSATQGILNLSFNKGTTDPSYSHDIMLRGDSKVQEVDVTSTVYAHAALISNGLSIRVKTFERMVSLYNIEVTVAKLI